MIRRKYIETEYEGEMAWNLTHSSSLGPIITWIHNLKHVA